MERIYSLLEQLSGMTKNSQNPVSAMKGMLKATAELREQEVPGNDYSRKLNKVVNLLEQGVPIPQVLKSSQGL